MVAVFALRKDFEAFKNSVDGTTNVSYKLVTDNIVQDFAEHTVDDVLFLENYTYGYSNLQRKYTQVMHYVTAPRSESLRNKLKTLISIERQVSLFRSSLISQI